MASKDQLETEAVPNTCIAASRRDLASGVPPGLGKLTLAEENDEDLANSAFTAAVLHARLQHEGDLVVVALQVHIDYFEITIGELHHGWLPVRISGNQ